MIKLHAISPFLKSLLNNVGGVCSVGAWVAWVACVGGVVGGVGGVSL